MSGDPKPTVFLDRDGVINEARVQDGRPYPPRDVSELRVIDGVKQALQRLKDCGFELVVVTNQPDIARGTTDPAIVEAINSTLMSSLPLDAIYVCPHDDSDECDCRKPKTGMIKDATRDRNLDLTRSFVVGDRWRDIEMGQSAGLDTVFIDYHYDEPQPQSCQMRVSHLADAVEWMCTSVNK